MVDGTCVSMIHVKEDESAARLHELEVGSAASHFHVRTVTGKTLRHLIFSLARAEGYMLPWDTLDAEEPEKPNEGKQR